MMPKSLLIVAAALLLAACHATPVRDENSPRSRIAVGSVVVLHHPLAVPAGHSRVFLQHGKVVGKTEREYYQPHCNFEQREVSRGNSTIEADRFVVTALSDGEVEVVRGEGRLHYASLIQVADMGLVLRARYVEYTLASARQPGVMRLTCHGGFAEPWAVRYPSVQQIREALGEWVTISVQ